MSVVDALLEEQATRELRASRLLASENERLLDALSLTVAQMTSALSGQEG